MKKRLMMMLFLGSIVLMGCGTNTKETVGETSMGIQALVQPDRKMDLYGKVISQEGNEYTIQEVDVSVDPTFGMEQEEKKAYMAQLSEDERMQMKADIRAAVLDEVKVMIPVGIPMETKIAQGQDAEVKMGTLDDITIGSYVSIWYNPDVTDQKIAEYLKKNFSN